MEIKSVKVGLLSLFAASVLAACAGVPAIGDKPGEVPPRLVVDAKDPKSSSWDRPSAFGPVPAELAANGDKVCSTLNANGVEFKAIGFHPKAQAANGTTLQNGGYFCVRR